ncbi:MAG: hypothetical protein H7067_11305, partial [Burkholderiales bacterium]|nr:hypothetical protein [Opitutaceae bacterium]
HFIGTDYAPPPLARPSVLPVAAEEGVSDLVAEHPARVPYYDALHYLARADAILLVGSDDPTYSASKLFPCLLARRPLLLVAHPGSLMLELARAQGVATAYGFPPAPEDFTPLAAHIRDHAFLAGRLLVTPAGDAAGLATHTAAGMTRRLAAIFDASVSAPTSA